MRIYETAFGDIPARISSVFAQRYYKSTSYSNKHKLPMPN